VIGGTNSTNHRRRRYTVVPNTNLMTKLVQLFTKKQCCLCDTAKFLLSKINHKIPFRLETIDITERIEFFEMYKNDIPVILINGKEVARHRLDENIFIKALQAEE
jgi:glutaredoxin